MLALKPETRLALGDDILIQALPETDQFFAFDVEIGDHFRLNETAHTVLDMIGTGVTFGKLVERFARSFDLKLEKATQDLFELVAFCFENALVKEVGYEEKGKGVQETQNCQGIQDEVSD